MLEYNLLYRWFLDMDLLECSFDATVSTKNRQRLMAHDVGRALFDEVVWAADGEGLLSDEHFSVDGTLIEAAAGLKGFRSKDGPSPPTDDDPGNPLVDFRGERRSNETHASTTDPEARLLRKGPGKEARLAFMGHVLMENRHGLLMDFTVSQATGTAERDAVPELLDGLRERGYRPRTLGADRGYDTKDCVKDIRGKRVTHSGLGAPQRAPRGLQDLRIPRWAATIWVSRAQRTPQALIPNAIAVTDFIQIRFFRSLLVKKRGQW